MKLEDLLYVLRSNAKIIDWDTMEEVGEFDTAYVEILDENMKIVANVKQLYEKEVICVNNNEDMIRILVK